MFDLTLIDYSIKCSKINDTYSNHYGMKSPRINIDIGT